MCINMFLSYTVYNASEFLEKFLPVVMLILCLLSYRGVLDIIKAHDGIIKQKKAYRDVFLPDAIMLRDRPV